MGTAKPTWVNHGHCQTNMGKLIGSPVCRMLGDTWQTRYRCAHVRWCKHVSNMYRPFRIIAVGFLMTVNTDEKASATHHSVAKKLAEVGHVSDFISCLPCLCINFPHQSSSPARYFKSADERSFEKKEKGREESFFFPFSFSKQT